MANRFFVLLGGVLAALAVALGALGAHALKDRLTPETLETFRLAAHYQMLHAMGLILVGLLGFYRPSRWLAAAGWLMLLGILLFSGCLDLWIATGTRGLMFLVPVGGSAFILAWLALAASQILTAGRKNP